jgi:cell fate regulator YaaT (PSP1 superfamily)
MLLNLKLSGKNGLFTPPSYSHYYRLKTMKEGNDKGNWYGWEVSRESQLDQANLYSIAKSFAESVNKGEAKVKYEEETPSTDAKVPF